MVEIVVITLIQDYLVMVTWSEIRKEIFHSSLNLLGLKFFLSVEIEDHLLSNSFVFRQIN